MEIQILYDTKSKRIISLNMQPPTDEVQYSNISVGFTPRKGQAIMKIDLEDNAINEILKSSIHKDYKIDIKNKRLTRTGKS